jgi:hypothetical protein
MAVRLNVLVNLAKLALRVDQKRRTQPIRVSLAKWNGSQRTD